MPVNLEEIVANPEIVREVINRGARVANGVILDTIGIELESIALHKDVVAKILREMPGRLGLNFKVHRDASSEMKVIPVNIKNGRRQDMVMFNYHTTSARKIFKEHGSMVVGYELISSPMTIDIVELSLWALLPQLENNGDFFSERCATHVHVGMAKNLGFIKSLFKLGLWADDLFFAVAGLGKRFRGYSNNAIYARPLISGPYVSYRGSYYQILNWKRALEAESLYDFYTSYAVDINGNIQKYHPARYFAINLFSVLLHGTIEFRHANQCFNPGLVTAYTKLCQMFAELGVKIRQVDLKKLEPGNPFETQSPSYYIYKLERLIALSREYECSYSLDETDALLLSNVIYKYRGIGINDVPVISHLEAAGNFNPDPDLIREGKLLKSEKRPIPDGHIDIHNIQDVSIM